MVPGQHAPNPSFNHTITLGLGCFVNDYFGLYPSELPNPSLSFCIVSSEALTRLLGIFLKTVDKLDL